MKIYLKIKPQPMLPWTELVNMSSVSVSEADLKNGSPKSGDMIAVNPDNPSDMWLVSEDYFKENYLEIEHEQ